MPRNLSGVYALPAGIPVTDGVDDILASQLNDPLQDIEADMNAARPIVAGGTGATTAREARANLMLVGSIVHCSRGGTADAITLTTGLNLPALVTGMRVSFVPSAANTGATTINVDGLGAVACRTVRNTALPAEYILTTTGLVTAAYNGTHWVVDRNPDLGSNGNGNWHRMADGTMICRHTVTTSSGTVSWTFPKEFSAGPAVLGTALAAADDRGVTTATPTATAVTVRGWTTIGGNWDGTIRVVAIGNWY
jgi:hypothetical protein